MVGYHQHTAHISDDNFQHTSHISDFITMGDGSYPHMKQIRKADDAAHKAWLKM